MNRKTLQKCIDELGKDNPKLDYVRGILETLIESLPEEKVYTPPTPRVSTGPTVMDDATLMEKEAITKLMK